jgi:hypothetical protein
MKKILCGEGEREREGEREEEGEEVKEGSKKHSSFSSFTNIDLFIE